MNEFTRIEVIGPSEREFVRYLDDEVMSYLIQDDGQTLKIFIKKVRKDEPTER